MKELLEIYKAIELSEEKRIKIMIKMINILNAQIGMNLYEEIVSELISTLDSYHDFTIKYKNNKRYNFIF